MTKRKHVIFIALTLLLTILISACKSDILFREKENYIHLTRWEYAVSEDELPILQIEELDFRPLRNPRKLSRLLPRGEGFVYLRHRFNSSQIPSDEKLGLFLGRIIWSDKTYLNRSLIGETGSFPPEPRNLWNITRLYSIPTMLLRDKRDNDLIVAIYTRAEGAFTDQPLIGPWEDMIKRKKVSTFLNIDINIIIFALLLFIASYHLMIYFQRRDDRSNLYYSLLLISFALYTINMFIGAIPGIPWLPYLIFQKVILSMEFIAVFFGAKFFQTYFGLDQSFKKNAFYYFLVLIPLVAINISWDYHVFMQLRSIVLLFVLFFIFLYLFWTVRAVIQKVPNSLPLMNGSIILFITVIHDVVVVILDMNSAVYITGWGFAFLLFSITYTLAGRFVSMHNEVEELNINLEKKVIQRTDELNRSLEDVQNLKEQQDGDYYLTTLLVNPLIMKIVESEIINVDFIVQQKKRFVFREREKEIGGDICSAHTIYLNNKKFIAFINADAMGKSMQGAGGVLVLGSVYQNIIERTHTEEREKKLYPEQWLKNCVRELHKIFESFDGSMLISMIVGLVDEATGFFYYINAEHPFMIMYRDDHSRFVDRELTFRKIGTTGMSGSIHVETLQLMENDIILMGSDGKDDLRMKEADGTEYINEDEKMILHLLDKTIKETPDMDNPDGQEILSRLVRHIEESGEVMDDLSLLMIRYGPVTDVERESADESVINSVYQASRLLREGRPQKARETLEKALKKAPRHREALRLMVKIDVSEKEFERGLEYLNTYIQENPGDSEFLYLASYCNRKIDRYTEATELGERVRIREPKHVKNLINLSHSYYLAENRERSQHILDEALKLEPDNSIVLRLKEKITNA